MLSSRFPKGQSNPRNKPLKEENYTFTTKNTGFRVRLLQAMCL